MTTPFHGRTFTFTQPDGNRIQLRGSGNQHHAVFETLDGYTVVRNPGTGFYELAQLSADGTRLEPAAGARGHLDGRRAAVAAGVRIGRAAVRSQIDASPMRPGGRRCDQRRTERRTRALTMRAAGGPAMAPPLRGTVGDFMGLCLLIDFPDVPSAIARDEVERFCNQPGYTGFGNKGSVRDYYLENSLGRCRYSNLVANYYRAKHPKSYYTDPSITQGVRARELILEALSHWKASAFGFTPLTADSGGFVYAMNVYYAGPVTNNWAEGLWPHAWNLAQAVEVAPGKSVHDYQFTAMDSELALGTFCHENGHMLCDYPDLYDYGYESSGVGAYCLMCAGANIDEKNPPHISAYLKRLSGWAGNVVAVEHDRQVTLTAGSNDFAMLAKNANEYYLLENRRRAGRDAALPDEGLLIWHVDETGDNSNEQRTASQHYELSVEQADGAFDLETRRNQYGDANDLFDAQRNRFADSTSPNSRWWDGTTSNLEIREITGPGAAIAFRTLLAPTGGGTATVQRSSTPGAVIPDNSAAGITDVITVEQSALIASAKVGVDITHTYRGDLQVTLQTPWGAAIGLHRKGEGGGNDDLKVTYDETAVPALASLRGRDMQGQWRLAIQDLAPADQGRLQSWSLEFATAPAQPQQVVLQEVPGTHIPDASPAGIQRSLTCAAAGSVASVELSVDITHTYIGDLRVVLRSPSGTEVVLHGATGGSADDLVKTYTAATTTPLGDLAGETAQGVWQLRIADLVGQDVGKLNSWRLLIHLAT